MQVLANALPGFRDMRAPLAAGYLWLLFVWLLLKPDLSNPPANATLASVYDLCARIGPGWIGLAAGLLAYFAGTLSQMITDHIETNFTPSSRARKRRLLELEYDSSHKYLDVMELPAGALIREIFTTMMRTWEETKSLIPKTMADEAAERIQVGHQSALHRSSDELELPATLLIGDAPVLFAEVDRMRAEGELRIAITPPLGSIIVALALQVSPWFWLAIPSVVALALQGARRKNESRKIIMDAMRTGRVDSPAVKAYQESMDRLASDLRSRANAQRTG